MVEKFAQRLNHLRVEAGLSFKELSKEVNISTASLCRWENGVTDVKGEQIVVLANDLSGSKFTHVKQVFNDQKLTFMCHCYKTKKANKEKA